MPKTVLASPTLSTPNGIMSHGVSSPAGKMVFVSGQVSRNAQGEIVGIGDIRAQTRQVLDNIKSVLTQGGASMSDVVKVTVFVTDVAEHYSDIHEIRAEYFPNEYPASTMVEVKPLVQPELMIEIEAIAMVS